jgi:hypothetical protein
MMILSTKAKLIVVLLPIAVVVALWALPGSAFAGEPFAIAKFENTVTNEGGAPDTRAASHPYALTTTIEFASHEGEENHHIPSGSVKDLEVGLPAGMIVNPNATQTKCSEAELDVAFKCPISAVVGVVYPELGFLEYTGVGFPVYNMVAPPGVPAAFGFVITTANIVVHIYGDARTGSDYGLSAKTIGVLGRALIDRVAVTLWGDPTAKSHDKERGLCAEEPLGTLSCEAPRLERPLLTLPSACTGEPLQAAVRADSWQEPENYQERTATSPAVTGCKELGRFGPTLSVQPTQPAPESPTGLEVTVKVPQEENVNALAEADLKEATVTLPAGMAVSPSAASGLAVCPLLRGREQEKEEREARGEAVGINLESQQRANCPDASKLGTVKIVTPLLETPLEGSVYVAQQGSPAGNGSNPFGSLLALYLVAEGDGVVVKLPGEVSLDPSTGKVSARFGKDPTTGFYLPQLPFGELKMDFFGGQRAPLVTPSSCGTYTTHSVLTPYGSEADPLLEPMNASAEPSSGFTLSEGCGARGFAPAFTAGVTSIQAGGSGDETVTIARNNGEQNLGGVTVTTPPGLLGLLSKVPLCQEPQAGQGTCSEASNIGETTEAVGPGEDPYWVKGGKVYLTGPYDNEPFGLSIVVPTVAGPFTLEGNGGFGKEVVRASIAVNPKTGALTIAGTLPTIIDGVPLDVRTINVDVNRESFVLDPTNCEEQHVTSSIVSTEGATATSSSRFQVANCAALPFKPSLSATTQGNGSDRNNGASLNVKVTQQSGEAGIHSAHFELPKKLPARLSTLQKACTEATFDANPANCPASSDVGTGIAHTPVLPVPLEGPAYFVSHGGAEYPELVFVLRGDGVTIELAGETHIDSKTKITSSTFGAVPDAPISSFEANLPEEPNSALATLTPKGLCGSASLSMPTTIVGQNGAEVKQTTKVAITGCPKKSSKSTKRHKRKPHERRKTRAKGKKAGRRS